MDETISTIKIEIDASSDGARKNIEKVSSSLKNLRSNSKNTIKVDSKGVDSANKKVSKLNTLLTSLKRIAIYRILRTAIKSVGQALSEGTEWAYWYSKSLENAGNGGGRFAASMDSVKTAASAMKAQLGSAFISILAAIEPILRTLIDLVTRAADAIAQLFAAFTGNTYIKANADGLANAFERGAGAAKEWKNQLMGFDEINRLNEPSGGGGGSSTDLHAIGEAAEIEQRWLGIADKLRPIIENLKMMFGGLRDVVVGILTGDWELAFNGAATIIEGFGKTVHTVLDGVKGAVDYAFDESEKDVVEFGKTLDEYFGTDGTFEKLGEDIAKVLDTIQLAFDSFFDEIGNGFEGVTKIVADIIRGDWAAAWEDAKNLAMRPSAIMTGGVTLNMSAVGNASADAAEAMATNMETVRNEMAATGQSSLQVYRSEGGIGFSAVIGNTIARIVRMVAGKYKGYASGGFPSEGQLFLAREAGPELVGTMGGRTAVANNDQIVEGIRQGVYDAVVAANGNGGGDVKVQVFLDSREIQAGQQRLARAWGA